jgi:hypothetical protein
MLRHAAMLEDAEEMRQTRRYAVGQDESQVLPAEFEARRAAIVEAALTRPRATLLAEFEALVADSPPPVNSPQLKAVVVTVERAQVARLAAGRREAAKATQEAQAAIDAVQPEYTVTLELKAIQARNLLRLLPDTPQAEAARVFLADYIARGYAVLRDFK